MPSKPKVPREDILRTALDILRRDGYGAINIKRLAAELGCSTQPISWQFGGMDGFRAALAETAMDYVQSRMASQATDPMRAFFESGTAVIDLAIEEPNLFRFVFTGESRLGFDGGLADFFNDNRNGMLLRGLVQMFSITPEQAGAFMNTLTIYTLGMALLIASGIVREDKAVAHRMLRDTGICFLLAQGVPRERLDVFFSA